MTGPVQSARRFLSYTLRHPIGSRQPVATLWRVATWQVQSRLRSGLHDKHWIENARLLVRRGMTGATGNLYFGLHEFADMAFLLHFLRSDDLMLDIGANVGTYTILAAKCVGARSIAFEPHPDTAGHLRRNVDHNGIADRVMIHQIALSDRRGTGALTDDLDTMNRVVAAGDDASRTIELETLDSIIGDATPIMIKIDVEGHEPQVFAGAAAVLNARSLQVIEIETVDDGIEQILRDAGFTERYYDPLSRALTMQPLSRPASNRLYVRDADFVAERLRSARSFNVAGITI